MAVTVISKITLFRSAWMGKEWGEPVNKGTFARDSKEKRVLFDKPVKARYIRFTALSEQNGQDFASGAEITILAN